MSTPHTELVKGPNGRLYTPEDAAELARLEELDQRLFDRQEDLVSEYQRSLALGNYAELLRVHAGCARHIAQLLTPLLSAEELSAELVLRLQQLLDDGLAVCRAALQPAMAYDRQAGERAEIAAERERCAEDQRAVYARGVEA